MSIKRTALLFAIPAAFALAPSRDASAQVEVSGGVTVTTPGVYIQPPTVYVAPPAAYIATTEPEYYENRPVYYYNNYWYYRDHGRWLYYRSEPDYLRERRMRWREDKYERRAEHERWERERAREKAERHEEHERRERERSMKPYRYYYRR